MNYKKFGANIRSKRRAAGLTLEKLAEKAEIGDNFLGKIERGQGKPSLETAIRIANALECGIDAFLNSDLTNVTSYLSDDIKRLTSGMDPESRKRFMEFMQISAGFFADKWRKE